MDTKQRAATGFPARTVLPPAMVIHGISARSRFGRGITPVVQAIAQAKGSRLNGPAPIEDFDIQTEIGPKGTRTLDRSTGLALSAVETLMAEAPAVMRADDTALILGTTMGSVSSTIRFTQDGLSGSRPYLVDPSRFPNTVMNFAAGQTAIRHHLTGPNATIVAGAVTGLASLRYAARMLRGGQSARVIVGATEELTPERKAIHDAGPASARALGEGSAMLLLGPAAEDGDSASGRTLIRGICTGFSALPGQRLDVVNLLVDRACGFSTGRRSPSLLAISGTGPEVDMLIRRVRGQIGCSVFDIVDVETALGDTGAVSGVFALGACSDILTQGRYGPAATGWVLGVDPSGYMGIAVLEATGHFDDGAEADE
jgi:3-oxoacyl-[acyl-carrier-protein] synthase II